ncbi:MAG TPA: hypothetical protein VF898_11000, partial [Chloroflexota bacterium]
MSRSASTGVRFLCLVFALVLAVPLLQPGRAMAQPVLGLAKQACTFVPTTTCSSSNVTAASGQTVQYNLTYSNASTGTTGTVTITDQLQPGQTYTTGSCTVPTTVPASTCIFTPAGMGTLAYVTFTINNVTPSTTGVVSFAVTINTGATGPITNRASASATGAVTVNSNQTTVNATPTVGLTKLVKDVTTAGSYGTNISARAGDTLRYAITVTNNGMVTASAVQVADPLQSGQTYVPSSCTPVS